MKKIIWIVAGVVVVVGVVLIGRQGTNSSVTKKTKNAGQAESGFSGGTGSVSSMNDAVRNESTISESSKSVEDPRSFGVDSLSAPVKALLGLDEKKHNYPSLLSAINELGDEISADDVTALMDMLSWSNDRFPGIRDIEINAVKNDVLDRLLRQSELPAGLGLHMVEMAGNLENDPVWRDYCLQFMTPFYERLSKEAGGMSSSTSVDSGDAVPPNELSVVREAMFAALEEREATLAGTSLIGLELLSRTHDEFDRELIVEKSVEIATDELASPSSRMTALRLSAQLSDAEPAVSSAEVASSARTLAQTGQTVLLRSAAIVTLGETGTDADRELLVAYTTDENRQIAEAARLALEKMDVRN